MADRTYYCSLCGQWFRGKNQIEIPHYHQGYESGLMLCKPADLKTKGGEYIGVKPIYGGKRWRAMLINIEEGYSENPSWGHEAGGWIHYTYESMRDQEDNYIEAATEEQLIDKLKVLPYVEPDSYFGKPQFKEES